MSSRSARKRRCGPSSPLEITDRMHEARQHEAEIYRLKAMPDVVVVIAPGG